LKSEENFGDLDRIKLICCENISQAASWRILNKETFQNSFSWRGKVEDYLGEYYCDKQAKKITNQ